jgi:hypothetical protein
MIGSPTQQRTARLLQDYRQVHDGTSVYAVPINAHRFANRIGRNDDNGEVSPC